MKRFLIVSIAAILCIVSSASSFELPKTPIQDQLKAGLWAFDNHDDFNTPDTAKTTKAKAANPEFSTKPKSGTKAVVLSALIPGAGEYYLGHRSRARFFFTSEAVAWVGFAAFRIYGHWKEDDMIRFARERANANLEGKSSNFQDLVGFYSDIDQYNTLGRAYDPQRPYLPDTPDNHWRWQNLDDQIAFRNIKNASREAYRRANFMVGLMIVNRLLSVIDTYTEVRNQRVGRETFSQASTPRYSLTIDPFSQTRQVQLTIRTPF